MKKAAIVMALGLSATCFANAAEHVTIMYKVVGSEGEAFQTDVPEYTWKSVRVDVSEVQATVDELKADPTIGDVEVAQKTSTPKPIKTEKAYSKTYAQSVGEDEVVYNDPEFPQQQVWQPYQDVSPGNLSISQGMDIYDTSKRMKIGVIDSGFVETNDIVYAAGANFFGGARGDAFVETDFDSTCDYRHGTQVAHLAAAEKNNGVGMVGVANADIYAARYSDCTGTGFSADLADAILWLAGEAVGGLSNQLSEPVDVINMSLSAYAECPGYIQDAIDVARSRGVVFVASAGNSSVDASGNFPANCAGVITVGSNTFDGRRSSFSNYGDVVDIYATGSRVFTTSNTGDYASVYGTSFSAPIVAGHVALIKAVEPDADDMRIIRMLNEAQRTMRNVNGDATVEGAGIMDSLKLAKAASGETFIAKPLVHALDHEDRVASEAAYTQAAAKLNTCGLYEVDTTKLSLSLGSGEFFKVFEVSKNIDFTVTNGTEVSSSQGSRVLLKKIDPSVNRYGLSLCNADNSTCDSEIPINLNASKALTDVYCS